MTMTESINEWHVTGNAGGEAELRYLSSGRAVCEVNIAVTEHVPATAENGDRMLRELTIWVRVTAWGPLGEALAERVRKGARVECWGRPGSEAWLDKGSGELKHRLRLTARRVLVDGSEVRVARQRDERRAQAAAHAPRAGGWGSADDGADVDDVPYE
jgi:single-strand DNA-binding protein